MEMAFNSETIKEGQKGTRRPSAGTHRAQEGTERKLV